MKRSRFPRVCVVVLNWNGRDDTLRCLESIRNLNYANHQTIVVDNGSVDDSPRLISSAFPNVTVLQNPSNQGYAAGNNGGILSALSRGADYVWLLNNDTLVEPETLSRLIDRGESDDRIGLLSPLIRDFDFPHAVQFCGTLADAQTKRFVTIRNKEDASVKADGHLLLLWGTALLVKSHVVRAIGYLDERYFAYQEDLDFALRALDAGFLNVVVDDAVVYHKVAASTGVHSRLRHGLLMRNEFLLWRGRLNGETRSRYALRYLGRSLEHSLNESSQGHFEAAAGRLDGAWSAFCGDRGPWRESRVMPPFLKAVLHYHPYFWTALLERGVRGVFADAVHRWAGWAGRSALAVQRNFSRNRSG